MAWRFVSFVTFHLYMATFQNTFIRPVRRKLPARGKLLQSQARPHRVPHRAPIELVCSEPEVDFASYSRCSCSCWLCSLAETSMPSAGAACFLCVSGDAQRAKKARPGCGTAVIGQLRKAACAAVATVSLHLPYDLLRDWLPLFSS